MLAFAVGIEVQRLLLWAQQQAVTFADGPINVQCFCNTVCNGSAACTQYAGMHTTIYHMLNCDFDVCIVYTVFSTLHCLFCTVYSALSTLHCLLCTTYSALSALHCLLYAVYSALSSLHRLL